MQRNEDEVACLYDKVTREFFTNGGTGEFLSNLNKNYIELEYIQTSGTQYIDTGITVSHHQVQTKMQMTTLNNNTFLFGSNYYHIGCYSNNMVSAFYSGNQEISLKTDSYLLNENTIIFNDSQHRVIINNETLRSDFLDYTPNRTIQILRRNGLGGVSTAKVWYFKVIDNSTGELLRDMIPVKRKSDNEICMYDKISEQYFTNQGTGTFVAGPEVI